jgi:D-alanyl-D-alanine dipeptidase
LRHCEIALPTVNGEDALMVPFGRSLIAVAIVAVVAGCTPAGLDRPAVSIPASAGSSTPATASPTSAPASISHRPTSVPASSRPRPAPTTRPSSAAPRIPPLSATARAAGLLDVRSIVADAIVDLRYATSNNFVGQRLYPPDARCLVHETMAPGLVVAADRLRREGYVLVFWDCYRPHEVQVHMFQVVPDANWVARPGTLARSHEAARSVDVTLARVAPATTCAADERVQGRCLVDMGTGFDDFTARAHAYATYGVSPQAQSNRSLLRTAMQDGGLAVYSGEWWHFDGPGALVGRPFLDVPVD